MKSIKYLLTAILMVSTGLSAMEPAGNALVPARVQAARDTGSMEAHLMAQPINVPNEQGQLPLNVAQQIAGYVDAERQRVEQPVREQEKRYNEFSKHTSRPIHLLFASVPMFAAGLLSYNVKCLLTGSAFLTSGLIWYFKADFNHNCHCTLDCYHYRNNSIIRNLIIGLAASSGPAVLASGLLYPAAVGLMAKAEHGFESEKSTGFLFGIKAASVPLVPLFAQRLLEGEGRQWLNAGMLATAAFASYSGLKDLLAYKRSHFKSFDAFLMGRDSMQFEETARVARNQNIDV